MFTPQTGILPEAQRAFWPELSQTPNNFVLYGGTAMALRLGHRTSEDFDFFCNEAFQPEHLWREIPYLRTARVDSRANNTLIAVVNRGSSVRVSFFGDVRMNHVKDPDIVNQGVQLASLLDLTATKLKTIQQRAEAKDYRDIAAALNGGVLLSEALGAAKAIYGGMFNPIAALKALSYFQDGNLALLPTDIQNVLSTQAKAIELKTIPVISARAGITRSSQ